MTIPQHLSIVTVGARDLPALREFYGSWGWQELEGSDDAWCAYDLGGCLLSLYPVDRLGEEAAPGVELAEGEWNGVTFAINFADEDLLRDGFGTAVAAGASVIAEPVTRFWGGITGYIADPEGNRWELGTGGPNPAPPA
jgi:catechol 2,3-dioxygenase-like lactoylglutathione lyase family enzyme